jgi:hypothetical protein
MSASGSLPPQLDAPYASLAATRRRSTLRLPASSPEGRWFSQAEVGQLPNGRANPVSASLLKPALFA